MPLGGYSLVCSESKEKASTIHRRKTTKYHIAIVISSCPLSAEYEYSA